MLEQIRPQAVNMFTSSPLFDPVHEGAYSSKNSKVIGSAILVAPTHCAS